MGAIFCFSSFISSGQLFSISLKLIYCVVNAHFQCFVLYFRISPFFLFLNTLFPSLSLCVCVQTQAQSHNATHEKIHGYVMLWLYDITFITFSRIIKKRKKKLKLQDTPNGLFWMDDSEMMIILHVEIMCAHFCNTSIEHICCCCCLFWHFKI